MNEQQKMVWDFHEAMNRPDMNSNILGIHKDPSVNNLRYNLIREELEELKVAIMHNDIVEVADALGDLLYVVYGAGCQFGIDLEPVFAEIQKSNLTKKGAVSRADGKITKGDKFVAPDLKKVLSKQKKSLRGKK